VRSRVCWNWRVRHLGSSTWRDRSAVSPRFNGTKFYIPVQEHIVIICRGMGTFTTTRKGHLRSAAMVRVMRRASMQPHRPRLSAGCPVLQGIEKFYLTHSTDLVLSAYQRTRASGQPTDAINRWDVIELLLEECEKCRWWVLKLGVPTEPNRHEATGSS